VKKLTAFLLIAIYLAFLGIVTFHIHEGQDPTNHLHCKLCEVHKLSVEKVIDSSLSIQPTSFMPLTIEKIVHVMLDDFLQVSGSDPPQV
jgi:hypothetical protein